MRRIHGKACCHAGLSSLYFPSSTFGSLSEDLQLLLDFTMETVGSISLRQASLAEGSSSHLHGRGYDEYSSESFDVCTADRLQGFENYT
jgi:hypothetical protein